MHVYSTGQVVGFWLVFSLLGALIGWQLNTIKTQKKINALISDIDVAQAEGFGEGWKEGFESGWSEQERIDDEELLQDEMDEQWNEFIVRQANAAAQVALMAQPGRRR